MLLQLPECVLLKILSYIELLELVQTVSLVNKTLNNTILHCHVLWENFDIVQDAIILNSHSVNLIKRHSQWLRKLCIAYASQDVPLYEIDLVFSRYICNAKHLRHLDISGSCISTLCFLPTLNSLQLLVLDECHNLVDEDFRVIKVCPNIEQLYVGYTHITSDTLIQLSMPCRTCIEAAGIVVTSAQLNTLLLQATHLRNLSISATGHRDVYSDLINKYSHVSIILH